ncbi:MAG: helix-turn-helix transcriptional regulator [Magnetococcales bacterium]|nr:helix-turn-helix transcriptional regulator [Nitrospirota bacterium]
MKEKLITDLNKRREGKSIYTMSKETQIPYATLWRIMNGKSNATMRILEKVEKYLISPLPPSPEDTP